MDLESIMLSEINQTKTNTVYHFYVESKKYNKLVNITKQTHRQRTNYCLPMGRGMGEGQDTSKGLRTTDYYV